MLFGSMHPLDMLQVREKLNTIAALSIVYNLYTSAIQTDELYSLPSRIALIYDINWLRIVQIAEINCHQTHRSTNCYIYKPSNAQTCHQTHSQFLPSQTRFARFLLPCGDGVHAFCVKMETM